MNTLALIQVILRHARETGQTGRVDEYLVKLAEKAGVPQEKIEDAIAEDTMLVIYAP